MKVMIVDNHAGVRNRARKLLASPGEVLKDELSKLRSLLIGGEIAPSQSNSEGAKAPESAHTTQPADSSDLRIKL